MSSKRFEHEPYQHARVESPAGARRQMQAIAGSPEARRRPRKREMTPLGEIIYPPTVPEGNVKERLEALKRREADASAIRTQELRQQLEAMKRGWRPGMETEGQIRVLYPPGLVSPIIPPPFPEMMERRAHKYLAQDAADRTNELVQALRAVEDCKTTSAALGETSAQTLKDLERRAREYRSAMMHTTKNELASILGLALAEGAEKNGRLDKAAEELAAFRLAWMDLDSLNKIIQSKTGLTPNEARTNPAFVNRNQERGLSGFFRRQARSFSGRAFYDKELEKLMAQQAEAEKRWTKRQGLVQFDRSPAGAAALKLARAFMDETTKNDGKRTPEQIAVFKEAARECDGLKYKLDDLMLDLDNADNDETAKIRITAAKIKARLEALAHTPGIPTSPLYKETRTALNELEQELDESSHLHEQTA
ncbi:MAG: hypothetical protein Q7R83_04555 [bacterium]|nr:hypothetical protein [bacterium]